MKMCSRCKQIKTVLEFKKNLKKKDGLQNICSVCSKELNKLWYKNNKDKKQTDTKSYRTKNINWLQKYKSTIQCSKCSENHPNCLEFHHTNQESKILDISTAVRNWSIHRLKTEIDKCIVLCANCHRKQHYMVYEA